MVVIFTLAYVSEGKRGAQVLERRNCIKIESGTISSLWVLTHARTYSYLVLCSLIINLTFLCEKNKVLQTFSTNKIECIPELNPHPHILSLVVVGMAIGTALPVMP